MRIIVSRATRGESLHFLWWGGIGDIKILRKRKGEASSSFFPPKSLTKINEHFWRNGNHEREREREKEILARRGRTGAFSEHVVVFILLAASQNVWSFRIQAYNPKNTNALNATFDCFSWKSWYIKFHLLCLNAPIPRCGVEEISIYYLLYVLSCVLDELNIVFLYGRER